MAKQGSIRHYRQTGAAKAPASLPYGELAVAKDGTLYAGSETGMPVEQARAAGGTASAAKLAAPRALLTDLSSEAAAAFDGTADARPGVTGALPVAHGGTGAATAAGARAALGLGNVDNTADSVKDVRWAATSNWAIEAGRTGNIAMSYNGNLSILFS